MKVTTFLLFAFLMHVSAATFSQITLKENNAQLAQVLKTVEKQSGYVFVYNNNQIQLGTITADLKNATIEETLKTLFKNKPITYQIVDKNIVLLPKKQEEDQATLLEKLKKAMGIQTTISGTVKDETGQPMPGVTVREKGTTGTDHTRGITGITATTTDTKGKFTINVPDNNTTIQFTYIGYEPQEYQAKDIATGSTITLKASETNLKEVVVSKGYYDEKKALLTGDVTVIDSKIIGEQPVSDPIMALEGRVPGLQITQASGIPGSNYTIRLRGQNSIANGNNPLFIVDGVPFTSTSLTSNDLGGGAVGFGPGPLNSQAGSGGLSPFNILNPSDIDNIEVLKDADATAIYGSRGANGVILITTKKGKPGQTQIDANINTGVGTVDHTIPFLNTQQYLALRNKADRNAGYPVQPYEYDINGTWDTTRYTNWEKQLIGNTAHFTNANLSLSGGSTNTQFLLGGNFSRQTTVFPGDNDDRKASMHLSLNHTSTNQKLHTQFTAQYANDQNKLPEISLSSYITTPPDAPALYNQDGSINFGSGTFDNPLAYNLKTFLASTNNLLANLHFDYEIVPGLHFNSSLGYNHQEMNQNALIPATAFYGPPNPFNRSNSFATTSLSSFIAEPQLNYDRKIGRGKLDILIGGTYQHDVTNSLTLSARNFSSDDLIDNIAAAGSIGNPNAEYAEYMRISLIARINYNWDDTYVINATANRDGSSRFGPDRQFGNFGAIGAAWIFSKEKFIENSLRFLSFGKFRASYGITGSDQIAPYQYISSYSAYTSSSYQGVEGLSPTRIANPFFAWEVNKKLEGGLELGFLNNRINLESSYYRNRSGNQLVGQPLPYNDGFISIVANLPALVQNTGFEFSINTTNIKGGDFQWLTTFNISDPKTKLISFPGLAENQYYRHSYAIGQPLAVSRQFVYTGVDPKTGLFSFKDLNGDGQINSSDYIFGKTPQVNFYGGLSNTFSYKSWKLDVFLNFVKQTGVNPLFMLSSPPGESSVNEPSFILNPSILPQTQVGGSNDADNTWGQAKNSTLRIVDASYIRLKNVSLTYGLPPGLLHFSGLKSGRIYLQAQNLITITGYKGLDPETQGVSLPPLRMITIGLQVSL